MLVQKARKETIKDYAHTDLYFNGVYLGYVIKNNSTLAVKNENWNFVSKSNKLQHCFERTKNLLIEKITNNWHKYLK